MADKSDDLSAIQITLDPNGGVYTLGEQTYYVAPDGSWFAYLKHTGILDGTDFRNVVASYLEYISDPDNV